MKITNSFKYLAVLAVIFLSPNIFSQKVLSEGWAKVNKLKLEDAVQIFLKDGEKNSNASSYLAASFLEEILTQNESSLEHFFKALKIEQNAAPFLISAMQSPRITENMEANPSIITALKEIALNTKDGFYQTYMYEKIGKYYESKAMLDSALNYFNKMGAVKVWKLIGPFENISGSGHQNQFLPEIEFEPEKKYICKENRVTNWFEPAAYRTDGWVDMLCYFSDPNSIFYGNTFIYSEERQKVQVRVGTSGSLKAYLNDQLILETAKETNNNADTFIAETYLQKGWNRLLIKVGYSEIDYCNFMVRLTDENGFSKNNLKFSNEKQDYPLNANEEHLIIKSTHEKFFEERLKIQPEDPVNYLLLGEAYSINHKSYESELVYKEGIKKFPENVLFPIHLGGRLMRDGKSTMYYTLIDKIDKSRDDIPLIIDTKLSKEMAKKNKENFTALFEKYKNKLTNIKSFYKYSIVYNAYQGNISEMMALVDSIYEKFPSDYDFVFMKANLDYSITRSFNSTIKIIEKYIAENYDPKAINNLLSLYVANSDWKKWRKTYDILLKFEPAQAEYYYEMAQKLHQTMDYQNAIDAVNFAIRLAPFNSDYYYLLGLCLNAVNKKTESLTSFQNAVKNNYTNYDARDQIKILTNNSDTDEALENIKLDEIISSAPGAEQYSSDYAVTLVQNLHYSIYEGRASEYKEEMLIRVLNNNGVEWYNNVNIPYYSNQTLDIEKAIVIKSDGSRVEGEISNSQIVFKSLEKNDFVYIRYKLRNHNKGLLSGNLWECRNLGSFQPVKKLKISVLMPENESLTIKTYNMDEKPSREKVIGSNKLLIWEKENIPAIDYEYYMPNIFDVGPNLYLSTLKDWNIVARWYLDITRSKINEHYEIKNKVNELLLGKDTLSEREKIRLIYDFVVNEISYVSVPFLQSDFVPQKASDVLINKIGDCKDVVTLFIAMLKEIGINSNYVLVRTIDEGKLYNAPPGMFFNHVIAVTYLDGKKQFYDLTAKSYPCFTLPESLDGVLALEIKSDTSEPFYLEDDFISRNNTVRNTNIIINEDYSATLNTESIKSGEAAAQMRSVFKGLSNEQRIKKFSENVSLSLTNFKINSLNMANADSLNNDFPYDFSITLNNFVNKTGNYRIFKIPWADELYQNQALSYSSRDYTYLIYNQPNEIENILIKIPGDLEPVELPENISLKCDNALCSITYELAGGMIKAKREFKLLNRIVSPENYSSYKDFYNKLSESERAQILLRQLK